MKYYPQLTKRQAAAALEEFLAERSPALERFRQALSADGRDPEAMMDGALQGLIPLWGWVLSQVKGPREPGATDPAAVPHEAWPSWERFTTENESVLSLESIHLLDGFISHLGRLVEERAPGAQWQIGQHPNKRYQLRHHPVLAAGGRQIFLPGPVATSAREVLAGRRAPVEEKIAEYAEAVIEALGAEQVRHKPPPEPLVEVNDLGEHPVRGRELEVALREDAALEYSRHIDQMVKDLAKETGIAGVVWEDHEVLLVSTGGWTAARLEQWVARYLQDNIDS